MAAKFYTFHITYGGLEDRIWRKAEASSNYRLDQLGYLVLATFDTMAYHLFEFHSKDRCYEIPEEYSPSAQIDRRGKTDQPIYYQERCTPWDYRSFGLDMANFLMRANIPLIEEGYAPFWQE